MKKEITSREQKIVTKQDGDTKIKTNIDNFKTYNHKILEADVYLITPENKSYEFYVQANTISNQGFIKIPKDGPKQCVIEKGEVLGYLTKLTEEELTELTKKKEKPKNKKQTPRKKVVSITPVYIRTEQKVNQKTPPAKKASQKALNKQKIRTRNKT